MKNFNSNIVGLLLACFWTANLWAQPNTEVYLFDVEITADSLLLSNPTNISNNDGYDNQPIFLNDDTILYSATRNGQTDIKAYHISTKTSQWLSDTKVGSEYSPTPIPGSQNISAIRLDTTGLQRLYSYNPKGKATPLLGDAKVGYHIWVDANTLLYTVLVNNRMDLVLSDKNGNNKQVIQENVGRSLQRIPNTNNISFVGKGKDNGFLQAFDPQTKAIDSITNTLVLQDFTWLNGQVLTAFGNELLLFNKTKNNWQRACSLKELGITNITRLAINTKKNKLALVAEIAPEKLIDQLVAAYNTKQTDVLFKFFTSDVWVSSFPKNKVYSGKAALKTQLDNYFNKISDATIKVVSRMVLGATVIDDALHTANGNTNRQVTIYTITDGRISHINYIVEQEAPDPAPIVQQQLNAYNQKAIDAFMATYADHIQLYNYPQELRPSGKELMRQSYQRFFETTADLHAAIKNRIVIGNKVIDLEEVIANGANFSAIAIYEVEDGKIAKVTFLQ